MNNVSIIVDAKYTGRGAFQQAHADVGKLGTAAKSGSAGIKGAFDNIANGAGSVDSKIAGVARNFAGLGMAAGVAGVAFAGAAVAARKAWDVMGEGAALVRIEARFSKLAQSIGTTSVALTAKLRAATHGTISDMELMASASQLISLRLADNEQQVVRLGAVAGTLNWDMQQVILTFANMSTMRLDALGLSVSDVTQKAEELELQGMSSQEAFKEAVILAGEAQKALLDVGDDAVRSMQQAEAGWQNAKDSFKMGMMGVGEATGFTSLVAGLGELLTLMTMSKEERQLKNIIDLLGVIKEDASKIDWEGWGGKHSAFIESVQRPPAATEDQFRLLAVMQQWKVEYAENAALVGVLDQEIQALNQTIKDQAEAAAWAAAGGRPLSELYTEWATAASVAGEQAQAFVNTFNEAIGGMMSANIDAGPLVQLSSGFEGVGVAAGGMTFSIDAANVSLYEAAKAAGASAGELALLGVATGQFTELEADAALKTAILQEAISRLAQKYADGQMSIQQVSAALREQIDIVAAMPSMFAAVGQASRQLDVLTGSGGGGNRPWYSPSAPLIRRDVEEVEKATKSFGGFTQQVDHLAEAHKRLASAFAAEVSAAPEGGLIDAAGVVNMEAANKALFQQAQAAGATAAQLALLGVATGQFTEEQAQAALKAAVLQEKIKQIAAGVASGQLSYGEAAGGLASFGEALNSGALGEVAGGIEGVAQAATDFASGTYEAELSVEDAAARTAIQEIIDLIGQASGTFYTHFVVTTTEAEGGGGATTGGGGGATTDRSSFTVPISPQTYTSDYRSSAVPGMGNRALTEYQGGTTYNVTVNNFVDGKAVPKQKLDDVTVDKMRAALDAIGVRR